MKWDIYKYDGLILAIESIEEHGKIVGWKHIYEETDPGETEIILDKIEANLEKSEIVWDDYKAIKTE